jgi:ribonuclease Z
MSNFIAKHKKTITITFSIVLVLGLALTWFYYNLPEFLVDDLFNLVVNTNQSANLFEKVGLYVITTGTGAPLPDEGRAGPQTIVIAGDQFLVFDAGPGSTHKMEVIPLEVGEVDALFLTHYHSDHIGDMGELMLKRWGGIGNDQPLPIYGPPGVEEVVAGFEAAYQLDVSYRVDHHGEEAMPTSGSGGEVHTFDLGTDLMSSAVVYQQGDVEVIAFNVDHTPVFPAVGYRVNYKDHSVVITGDTIYTESLTQHAMGADVLVSEALNHKFSQMLSEASREIENNTSIVAEDIQDYHITPEQAGMVARDAGIPYLIITHVLPPVPNQILVNPFLRDARAVYDGDIYMANDGTMIKIPVDSNKITIVELLK